MAGWRLAVLGLRLVAVLLAGGVAACRFDLSGMDLADAGLLPGSDAAPDVAGDAPDGNGPSPGDAALPDGVDAADDGAPPVDAGAEAAPNDGGVDAGSCTGWALTPSNFDPCDPALPLPTRDLVIGPGLWTLDTDSGTLAEAGGATETLSSAVLGQSSTTAPDLFVVVAVGLQVDIGAYVFLRGSRAVVVVVYGTATIDGTLDVSAQVEGLDAIPGAGGNHAGACGDGTGLPGGNAASGSPNTGGGGGGGGGFGLAGGAGGDGHGGGHGVGAAASSPNGNTTLTPLRGGCGGGPGGEPDGQGVLLAGPGGPGGGAIQIAARDAIAMNGSIQAAGFGGYGGAWTPGGGRAGAGGGGSGGAIFLEAPSVTVTDSASLCANGGAGGEGSDSSEFGSVGQSGSCSETSPATSSGRASDGGDGGDGAYGSHAATNGSNGAGEGGGGGGGGGVGRLRVRATVTRTIDSSATVTPGASP
jgi:hypothetical protein